MDLIYNISAWPELELEKQSDALKRELIYESDSAVADAGQYTDLELSGDTWKLLHGAPRDPAPGQVVVMRSYATGAKKAVIDRDTDLLTPAELQTESARFCEALHKELKTWVRYVFSPDTQDHQHVTSSTRAGSSNGSG